MNFLSTLTFFLILAVIVHCIVTLYINRKSLKINDILLVTGVYSVIIFFLICGMYAFKVNLNIESYSRNIIIGVLFMFGKAVTIGLFILLVISILFLTYPYIKKFIIELYNNYKKYIKKR